MLYELSNWAKKKIFQDFLFPKIKIFRISAHIYKSHVKFIIWFVHKSFVTNAFREISESKIGEMKKNSFSAKCITDRTGDKDFVFITFLYFLMKYIFGQQQTWLFRQQSQQGYINIILGCYC